MNFEEEKNIYSQNLQNFEFLDKNPERFPRFRLVLWSKMPDYCANPQKSKVLDSLALGQVQSQQIY